jgi:chromosome segregation ATPase
MNLFNNKKLAELQQENEGLRKILKDIEGREQKILHLQEAQKKLQSELIELNEKKSEQRNELNIIKRQKYDAEKTYHQIKSEINRLEKLKPGKNSQFVQSFDEEFDAGEKTVLINKQSSDKISHQKELASQIEEAQIKKDKLTGENIRLEESVNELLEQVEALQKVKGSLEYRINEINSELHQHVHDNTFTTNEKLAAIAEKIEALKTRGRNELNEIQSRIAELTNEEDALRDRINLRLRELEEIEDTTIKDSSAYKKASEDKLLSLIVEEQNVIESIEKKQKYIKDLNDKISQLKQLELKVFNEIEHRVEKLKIKEIELKGNINLLQLELDEKKAAKEKIDETEERLIALLQEEQNIKDKISQLLETESYKKALINELNDKMSAREIEFAAISKDFERQSGQFDAANLKLQHLAEELDLKQKELLAVVQTINSKTERIKTLRSEAEGLEEKINILRGEASKIEKTAADMEARVNAGRIELEKFAEEKNKIAEMIPELQKRRTEIQQGNKALEERFSELFQKFNKEITQANQKRNVLDQIIAKKEKDLDEKDKILFEKLAALEDSERVLNMKQAEIESFDDLLKTVNEQKEFLKNDLIKLDDNAAEKRILNNDLRMETEFLQKKMTEIERNIQDLLNSSSTRFQKTSNLRITLDSEVQEYESRLNDLNQKIKDSMNELVDLRSSISNIKLEHEEHRLSIAKYISIKKKLDDEIKKNQNLLNKYRQIREKIKIERTTMTKIEDAPEIDMDTTEEKLKALSGTDYERIFKHR